MGWSFEGIQRQVYIGGIAKEGTIVEMTYLIDTNVFLEILLEQENYEAALSFIRNNKELYMSDFSLHSIGVILVRLEKPDVFLDFTH